MNFEVVSKEFQTDKIYLNNASVSVMPKISIEAMKQFLIDYSEMGPDSPESEIFIKELWEKTLANKATYFPPTYKQDEFTHATANPNFLLTIGNHFYKEVEGDWLCLKMSVESLSATGVKTIFEGTAPVGDKQADFEGTDSELFPHILGGIHPSAVLEVHEVVRDDSGRFLAVAGVVE